VSFVNDCAGCVRLHAVGPKDEGVGITLCQIANPCQFSDLVAQMGANARVSFSLAVTKGRDNEFTGAVDAVRVNDAVYDFEPEGVFARHA